MFQSKFGKNPNQAYMTKLYIVVNFVNAFGYSFPRVIEHLINTKKRGFAKKLVQKGILVEEKITRPVPTMPAKLIKLTELGKSLLSAQATTRKINPNNFLHDYKVQLYTVKLIKEYKKYYKTIAISRIQDIPILYKKDYDAIVYLDKKEIIAVEVELNRKKEKTVHINIEKMIQDLINSKNIGKTMKIHIVGTPTAVNAYKSVIIEKGIYSKYIKDKTTGKYKKVKDIPIIPALSKAFYFEYL